MKNLIFSLLICSGFTSYAQNPFQGGLIARPEVRAFAVEERLSRSPTDLRTQKDIRLKVIGFAGIRLDFELGKKGFYRSDMLISVTSLPFDYVRLNGLLGYNPTPVMGVFLGVSGDYNHLIDDRVNMSIVGGVEHVLHTGKQLDIKIDTGFYFEVINKDHSLATGLSFIFK